VNLQVLKQKGQNGLYLQCQGLGNVPAVRTPTAGYIWKNVIRAVITWSPGTERINYFSLTPTKICLPETPFIKTAIESRI